jgi:hypothetical protein
VLPIVRSEEELILLSVRTYRDTHVIERLKVLLRSSIDCDYLFQTALRHGVAPLVYWILHETCPDAVSVEVLNRFRDHFKNIAWRNVFLTGELLKFLKLFASHQIPAIPFKGPALAISIYNNLALRDFGDLDVMIREEDIPQVGQILIANGYRPQFRLTQVQEANLPKYRCEQAFTSEDDTVMIDLHWRFDPPYLSFSVKPQLLENTLETVVLGGKKVLTFPSEDLLLMLCMHGAKHRWERLGWICDVAKLLEVKKTLDWGRVLKHAEALGCQRMLFIGLFLANRVLGANLPANISHQMETALIAKSLAIQVEKNLFSSLKGFRKNFKETIFYLKSMEKLGDRVRHFCHLTVVPTPLEWELLPLPKALFFMYYLLRPIRLIGKYCRKLLDGIPGVLKAKPNPREAFNED